MTKTAYVTGSTGFLGLNIVQELVNEGWDVITLRRKSSNTADLNQFNVKQVEGDVLNRASLEATIPDNVDAIFHVAADTGLWFKHNERQNKINIEGTRNLVEMALLKKAKRLIHTSSIGAYGNVDGEIKEDTPSKALTSGINYYRSKYLAEQEIHKGISQGLDAVILNPAQIVGPFDYNYTPQIIDTIQRGAMKGIPHGGVCCGHVRDYAKAHLAAFEKGRTGENYLLGGKHASFQEMFDTVGAMLNKPIPTTKLPRPLLNATAFVMDKLSHLTGKEPLLTPEKVALMNYTMHINSEKAEKELGFSTCSIDEMYLDCYQWMQRSGMV